VVPELAEGRTDGTNNKKRRGAKGKENGQSEGKTERQDEKA